jgi:uncharacterized protein YqiB (DUF1249 family)
MSDRVGHDRMSVDVRFSNRPFRVKRVSDYPPLQC